MSGEENPSPSAMIAIAVRAAELGWESASHEVTAFARAHDLSGRDYGRVAGLATALLLERGQAQMALYPEGPAVAEIVLSIMEKRP